MQLLEHFKELTLHPKNAEELKGLILQLAVQGKLTQKWREENPEIEPAEKLLVRIKKYNAENLAKKGRRVKSQKVEMEIELDLPSKWIQVRNQDLFTLQKGKNPKDLSETIKNYPYQDIEALDRGNVRRFSNDEKAPKCTDEDILVVCDGSRSGLVLDGKTGIVGSTLAIIETPPFIKEYIKIIFQQDYQRANSNMIGAAIPHLDTKNLLLEVIGLPPLAEQKAIVEVVNQLFAEVEQLEALTKERIQLKEDFVTSALNQLTQAAESDVATHWELVKSQFGIFFTEKSSIKKLREAILQLAVQGKLTHHWRSSARLSARLPDGQGVEVEPASVLLEKIKTEKEQLIKAGKIKKEKPLPEISEDEIPYELPGGWVWCRLSQITELITKGSSPNWQGVQYVEEGKGILFVTSENVGSYELIWKNKKFVETKFNEIEPRSILKKNDLLMNIVGGSIGRTAIYNIDEVANINQAVTIIRLLPLNSFDFMLHFFNSPTCISYMFDKQVDNARPNLSMGNIANFLIPLPSLKEQKAIVEKVNGLMALCDQLEQEIETHHTTQEHWMQSCLREVVQVESVEEPFLPIAAEPSERYGKK
ncbi:restriction endonuclease subunit S [Algoriphagus marincola]|uniref:restriction endonuclease subunit S n=1 Tax=Algoriphagus marincola TaxID=264027 RepID=UPI000415CA5E|nr:restriction endonuclease subunit S [Algoriphagus marincola]